LLTGKRFYLQILKVMVVSMCTVLVIDDEQPILNFLLALTQHGYHVQTAADGREGIQKFDNEFIDIVITDVCMPDVDGREVARHVRNSHRKTTPIIAISGTPWLLEDSEFDRVLAKPFPLQTLYDTVEHLAGRPPTHTAVA
jgi:DNA-binding response OmpR family regulator